MSDYIDTSRRAYISFLAVRGDTWAPSGIAFSTENNGITTPEDFTGSTLTMAINSNGRLVKQLINGNGIAVNANVLQLTISAADMEVLKPGIYQYDVRKTVDTVVQTILCGTITVLNQYQ
jgi:hypothetical protein